MNVRLPKQPLTDCQHRNILQRSSSTQGLQALRLARRIEPDRHRLMMSWRSDPIAALDHMTARELVRRGFAGALETYLLEIIEGRRD